MKYTGNGMVTRMFPAGIYVLFSIRRPTRWPAESTSPRSDPRSCQRRRLRTTEPRWRQWPAAVAAVRMLRRWRSRPRPSGGRRRPQSRRRVRGHGARTWVRMAACAATMGAKSREIVDGCVFRWRFARGRARQRALCDAPGRREISYRRTSGAGDLGRGGGGGPSPRGRRAAARWSRRIAGRENRPRYDPRSDSRNGNNNDRRSHFFHVYVACTLGYFLFGPLANFNCYVPQNRLRTIKKKISMCRNLFFSAKSVVTSWVFTRNFSILRKYNCLPIYLQRIILKHRRYTIYEYKKPKTNHVWPHENLLVYNAGLG